MGIIYKLQKSNTKQKLVISIGIITISLIIFEYGVIILPLTLFAIGIPMLFLYSVWEVPKNIKVDNREKGRFHNQMFDFISGLFKAIIIGLAGSVVGILAFLFAPINEFWEYLRSNLIILFAFNIAYIMFFSIVLGAYLVLDYGDWAYKEILEKESDNKSPDRFKSKRRNIRLLKLIIYLGWFLSLIVLVFFNLHNPNFFLFFMVYVAVILLMPQFRNLVSNLAIKSILQRKLVKKFLLRN